MSVLSCVVLVCCMCGMLVVECASNACAYVCVDCVLCLYVEYVATVYNIIVFMSIFQAT